MQKKSLLIVDDDEKIIKMLTFLFLSKGYRVNAAKNGIEALEQLESSIPSAIILDLAMPRMDGFILYDKVQGQDNLKTIPVIVLSALPVEDNLYKLNLQDPGHYVLKPFRTAELSSLVKEVTKDIAQEETSHHFEFCTNAKLYIESSKI